jgi:hypothetical protein
MGNQPDLLRGMMYPLRIADIANGNIICSHTQYNIPLTYQTKQAVTI